MNGTIPDNWFTQLRKGVLELCVLKAVQSGREYGYDIVRRLREIRSLMIREGTIYPILSRLKVDGYLDVKVEESTEGPPRKCYRLTARGIRVLESMDSHWSELVDDIQALHKEARS